MLSVQAGQKVIREFIASGVRGRRATKRYEVVVVTKVTPKRIYIGKSMYDLDGLPVQGSHGMLSASTPKQIAELERKKEAEREQQRQKEAAELANAPLQAAKLLVNLGAYSAEELLDMYGGDRCQAVAKLLRASAMEVDTWFMGLPDAERLKVNQQVQGMSGSRAVNQKKYLLLLYIGSFLD